MTSLTQSMNRNTETLERIEKLLKNQWGTPRPSEREEMLQEALEMIQLRLAKGGGFEAIFRCLERIANDALAGTPDEDLYHGIRQPIHIIGR